MSEEDKQTESLNTAEGFDPLTDAARPELYRQNAFRITELPVEATPREIARQADKLKMLEKFGGARARSAALALDPPPDAHAVREAIQRLHDPTRRIVDELFWFWPLKGGKAGDDKAIAVLAQGKVKEATDFWLKAEKSAADKDRAATHNLAVIAHAAALDLEAVGASRSLSEKQCGQRDLYWQQAYQRWGALLEHEGFWSRVTARIRELDDARLTTGAARRLRTALPDALLSVNAALALRAAEAGDADGVKRQLGVMERSGLDGGVAARALEGVATPVRERVKTLCKDAEPEADKDPAHADAVSRRLLEQTAPMLRALDLLLPEGNPLREAAHDEVALRALACQIVFGNKTDNWKVSLELLERSLAVAASASARQRIEENTGIVKRNYEHQQQYGTCWFCGKRPSEDGRAVEIKMFKVVERLLNRIRYQQGTFKVPRCGPCRTAHGNFFWFLFFGAVLGALAGSGGYGAVSYWVAPALGAIVFLACVAAYASLGFITHRSRYGKIKLEVAKNEFPVVKQMRKDGWEFGDKPPGVQ